MTGLFISFEGVDGVGKTTQVERLRAYCEAHGRAVVVTREPGGTALGLAIRQLLLHGVSAPSANTGVPQRVDAADSCTGSPQGLGDSRNAGTATSLADVSWNADTSYGADAPQNTSADSAHIAPVDTDAPRSAPSADIAPRAEALLFAADRAQHVAETIRPALAQGDIVITDRYLDSSLAYQAGGRELTIGEIRDLSLWATGGLLPDRTYLLDMDPALSHNRLDHAADRMESAGGGFQSRTRQAFLDLAAAEPKRFCVIDASRPIDEVWAAIETDIGRLIEWKTRLETPAKDGPTDPVAGQKADPKESA